MRAELAAALAVAVLGLAACSDDTDPPAAPAPTATTSQAALTCERVRGADLSTWLGVPLEVAANPTDGGTGCSAQHLGDVLVQVQWARVEGADSIEMAAGQVFAGRSPRPAVEETTLPGGAPARRVVTEDPGAQVQVDLVTMSDGDGLHVLVSAGSTTGRLSITRARLEGAAARIAAAYADPAG